MLGSSRVAIHITPAAHGYTSTRQPELEFSHLVILAEDITYVGSAPRREADGVHLWTAVSRLQGKGSKNAKVIRCSTAAPAPSCAAGLGADLAGSLEKGSSVAPCMHKHSPSAASVRTSDSDQSSGSIISMSESASDRCCLCFLKL